MNEYHLISSHDHFRWKSAGSSIIRCTRRLKAVDKPLLKYGKLSKLISSSMHACNKIPKYPVQCLNSFIRKTLVHYSLKITAILENRDWKTDAEISMHGKQKVAMANRNNEILSISVDKIKQLKDAASPSPVIIKVQCYKDLVIFNDPIVTGMCYESYVQGNYSPVKTYGKSLPELSVSIFDKLIKDRIEYSDDIRYLSETLMVYLRREPVLIKCFVTEIKANTECDILDMYSGESPHIHIEFMYLHMHLCLLTLLYDFILGAIWPFVLTLFSRNRKREINQGQPTDIDKLCNKMIDYLKFLSESKNEIMKVKADPRLLVEIIIKVVNMPINREEMSLIINAIQNCTRRSYYKVTKDMFTGVMNNTIDYKQLSADYQYFTTTNTDHIKAMNFISAMSYNNTFISSMTHTRYLQASHRSSSHKPPDDSIHYKRFSIRLLSKLATVEVYCIDTQQLLHVKHFDNQITSTIIDHMANDYWLMAAYMPGND